MASPWSRLISAAREPVYRLKEVFHLIDLWSVEGNSQGNGTPNLTLVTSSPSSCLYGPGGFHHFYF